MALDILAGLRVLTRRPTQMGERQAVVLGRAAALAVADRVLAAWPPSGPLDTENDDRRRGAGAREQRGRMTL